MNLLLEGAIESSLILIVALGATALLRGRPAALRHAVLAAAIACAAIAPLLGRAVPAWPLPTSLASLTADTSAALQWAGAPAGGVVGAAVTAGGKVEADPIAVARLDGPRDPGRDLDRRRRLHDPRADDWLSAARGDRGAGASDDRPEMDAPR